MCIRHYLSDTNEKYLRMLEELRFEELENMGRTSLFELDENETYELEERVRIRLQSLLS